jgi:acyl phosphate:glycerol-3-phosphate acyltransferase
VPEPTVAFISSLPKLSTRASGGAFCQSFFGARQWFLPVNSIVMWGTPMLTRFLLASAIAFLLGSIPFGLILVRVFRGVDVRQTGSGNIGTANVARIAPGLGLWTLILDSAKGLVAVLIAQLIANHASPQAADSRNSALIVGGGALFAVLGHMFSVFLKGKGGKGVATAMGAFLAMTPWAVLAAAVIYALIYLLWRYTSLASIVAAVIFPLIAAEFIAPSQRPVLLPFVVVVCLLIVLKHHQNIRRLLSGTENRLELKRR